MARHYSYYRSRSLHWFVDVIFGIIETLIGLRIILKLFGASQSSPFVRWIYDTTQPLITPFQGIFPAARIEGAFILEISAIFALIIYALINYLIDWIIDEINYRNDHRIEEE